jgi:prepilin-type N-terminal cleavage/methylation domain-containing protein
MTMGSMRKKSANARDFQMKCGRRPRRPNADLQGNLGFTLVELMIVLCILGIIAALVAPRFTDASHTARENTLKDDLRYLRTQIVVFKAQHRDVPPGYTSGDVSATPNEGEFLSQMTGKTNELCGVGTSDQYPLGPYLTNMPPNPVNGLNSIRVVANGAALGDPDNHSGWIFKPQTLEIIPNLEGVDSEGRSYTDY